MSLVRESSEHSRDENTSEVGELFDYFEDAGWDTGAYIEPGKPQIGGLKRRTGDNVEGFLRYFEEEKGKWNISAMKGGTEVLITSFQHSNEYRLKVERGSEVVARESSYSFTDIRDFVEDEIEGWNRYKRFF